MFTRCKSITASRPVLAATDISNPILEFIRRDLLGPCPDVLRPLVLLISLPWLMLAAKCFGGGGGVVE
jgi:hypothetical protein